MVQGVALPALPPALERAPRTRLTWLWLASTHALIERQAEALGLRQELHAEQALVRLWQPAQHAEEAPWHTFEAALELLAALAAGARVELAQADDQAETLPSPVAVVEARMVRQSCAPQSRPRQRPGLREARRWPALWRWVAEEARRTRPA